MTFLEPLLLLGLLGAAVPVLVHLLGRPRARPQRFPAVELIQRALQHPAPRRRLRDVLLLAARIAAAVLLALVLARPALWASGAAGAGAKRIAVVLDDSFSMGLRSGRHTIFEDAKEQARAAIETALGAGGEAALLLGGRGGTDPVPRPTSDRRRLLLALEALSPSARTTDLGDAVARARAALGANGRVVVVTDGTAAVSGQDLDVVDVGKAGDLGNLAVTRVEVEPADEPGALAVTAEVANFSDRARTVGLALRVQDRVLSRANLTLAPRARQEKRLSLRPPAGAAAASLSIDADDLPIDDTRHFAVTGATEVRALLVDGDPRQARAEDELFYLRTALETAGDPPVRVRTSAPEQLAARLGDQDVVMLCNVRELPDADAQALRGFVRGGGGLIVTAGGNIDPDAHLPVSDLLPGTPASVWSAGPRGADEDPDRLTRIGDVDFSHPALASFAADPDLLHSARFWSRLLVRPEAGADRRTLARFEDGAPALLERKAGNGRVLFFASTIDRDWNDLVIRPVFAPLLRQLARYAGRRASTVAADVLVGEPCPLPATARGEARVARPDGREDHAEGAYAATDAPGVYRITTADGTRIACAVNVDTRESDLRRVPMPKPSAQAKAARHPVPVAHAFAAVLLGLLLAESLLAGRR
jgi:aerotolerance regulator-like protein/VWA domain-containing protein